MTMATSLMDFILSLLQDDHAKAAFAANPDKALHDAGLSGVCGQDVSDAMSYVAEYHPVSFVGNREYNVGNTAVSQTASSHEPDVHATAVHQLEYVSNNYSYVDSHDTIIDKSVNQNIWNSGSLTQSFDDHSVTATDHSVAAGDDIVGSNVATGNHDVTGNGNDTGNTTTTSTDDHSISGSFDGNNIADHGSVAGDGNQLADHGGVAGNGNDGNVTNPDHSNVATNGGQADASTTDSHDTTTTDSHDTTTTDSNNTTTADSHDTSTADSNNTDSHNVDVHKVAIENTDSHDYSHNDDSAITHTDQTGLLNVDVSPAVNVPIHDNELDVNHLLFHG
ncbi:MAG: IniB N-terminal domain-containing protein [Pseudonocardiaceae bacterium]